MPETPPLSKILGNVTHELKTPLHSMLAITQLLLSESDGPLNDEQRRQVGMIRRNGEQLLELITSLLQYTNLESRTQKPKPERFSAKLLFEEIGQVLLPLAERQQIRLESTLDNCPERFVTDRTLLRLIAMNLLTNALKFSPTGSVLSFYAASGQGEALILEVADSGIGIPQELQKSIFAEFYQVENSESRRFGGVGLGLSLVRSAVSVLGGTIELKSEENQGSLFRITLPLLQLPERRVFLQSGDEGTALALEIALSAHDCHLIKGEHEAPTNAGLIILDCRNRAELTNSGLTSAQIPILALLPETEILPNEVGELGILGKPFDVGELTRRVLSFLEER